MPSMSTKGGFTVSNIFVCPITNSADVQVGTRRNKVFIGLIYASYESTASAKATCNTKDWKCKTHRSPCVMHY